MNPNLKERVMEIINSNETEEYLDRHENIVQPRNTGGLFPTVSENKNITGREHICCQLVRFKF